MNNTANKTVNILSRHAKLSDAVRAAKIDLSYNEPLALADLARTDRDSKHGEAFVVEDSKGAVEVLYVFNCDIGILHRYSPFHSCLDDTPFGFAVDQGDKIEFLPRALKKTKQNREFIRNTQVAFSAEGRNVYAY